MYYNLSTGKLVQVQFNHLYKEVVREHKISTKKTAFVPFGTQCIITIDGKSSVNTDVRCHKNDQFTKIKGRLKAFSKALSYYRIDGYVSLDKEERRELFNLVFPKLANINQPKRTKKLLNHDLNQKLKQQTPITPRQPKQGFCAWLYKLVADGLRITQ